MTWYEDMTWCDGCGVEITWGPVLVEQRTYCCRECSLDIPCACGERLELDEDQRSDRAATAPTNHGYMI